MVLVWLSALGSTITIIVFVVLTTHYMKHNTLEGNTDLKRAIAQNVPSLSLDRFTLNGWQHFTFHTLPCIPAWCFFLCGRHNSKVSGYLFCSVTSIILTSKYIIDQSTHPSTLVVILWLTLHPVYLILYSYISLSLKRFAFAHSRLGYFYNYPARMCIK